MSTKKQESGKSFIAQSKLQTFLHYWFRSQNLDEFSANAADFGVKLTEGGGVVLEAVILSAKKPLNTVFSHSLLFILFLFIFVLLLHELIMTLMSILSLHVCDLIYKI